jgi:hypothetical protein
MVVSVGALVEVDNEGYEDDIGGTEGLNLFTQSRSPTHVECVYQHSNHRK